MIAGTAGHIDHGKTSLVRALTGVDTDRLPEEKKRGISVELGFAFLDAGDGQRIGFVDVPGHERLVHTMVAGATGMDFALLLVAADDGVMPQTREHLAVLTLLGVRDGVVVVTKADRVDDHRLQEVYGQVGELLAGSALAGAPVMTVSAYTGQGIDDLREHLCIHARGLATQAAAAGEGFRLAIDRVFSLDGSGTTVTGTIHAGTVRPGQALALVPGDRVVRVRSVHAQNQAVGQAHKGQRCALVLAGAVRDDIHRGHWVVDSPLAHSSGRIDVDLSVWRDEEKALRSGTRVHVHAGSSAVLGTVAILDGDSLAPGARGIGQIVLQQPLPIWWGDRVILRDGSGSRTVAGGAVLDPDAPARYRRTPERLAALDALGRQDPAERLMVLTSRSSLGVDLAHFRRIHGLLDVPLGPGLLRYQDAQSDWALDAGQAAAIRTRILDALQAFHGRHPDQLGPDAARLRRLAMPRLHQTLWQALLDQLRSEGAIIARGAFIHSPSHDAALSSQDELIAQAVAPHIQEAGFAGAWVRDLARQCATAEGQMRASLARLARQGQLHQIVRDLYYDLATVQTLAQIARQLAQEQDGELAAATFRDAIGQGRKRAIQILEYFDRIGMMRRTGDVHRLRPESTLFLDDASADDQSGQPLVGQSV